MNGHGHVNPNSDGSKARCGGPALCSVCAAELLDVANLGGPPVLSPLEERVAALERFAAEVGPLVEGLSNTVALMGGSFS